MGLNMHQKQAVTREYRPRYQKASKKEKQALLDEFTRLTGYHRKSAARLLNARPLREALVTLDGKPVKLKPEKNGPKTAKASGLYTDEVIAALRALWAFFWYKCGKILAPLMRQQMRYISEWPAFKITPEIAEKLKTISPATIDRYLKKDKEALRLKGKSLTKPLCSLKSRIPIRTFYTSEERKIPGFWQIVENGELPREYKDTLERQRTLYNPVELQQNVNKAILRLRQRLAQANRIQTQEQE
jgi:hypothetical protein